MPSCREIDPLVTPYIDGEATAAERAAVDAHLSACPPCRQRAEAETSARDTLRFLAVSGALGSRDIRNKPFCIRNFLCFYR